MKFLLSALSLFLVASEAATIRKTLVLPAAQECNPNKAVARMASTSSASTQCEPGSHCVRNGVSSLGGFCHDDDIEPNMDMPEALRILCFVCESPDNNAERQGSEVTKPDEIVGRYTCGELEEMGKAGNIAKGQCPIFQNMILANDFCGCSLPATAVAAPGPPAEDASESEDDSGNSYTYRNHVESVAQGDPLTGDTNPFIRSGSSSMTIAITGAASVVTIFLLTL